MATRNEQTTQAIQNIEAAFKLFAEARGHLTIWEFQDAIANRLPECGSQGFVDSVGRAIVAAANASKVGACG